MFCGIRLNVQHLLTIWHYNFASIDHHLLIHNWYHGMKLKSVMIHFYAKYQVIVGIAFI